MHFPRVCLLFLLALLVTSCTGYQSGRYDAGSLQLATHDREIALDVVACRERLTDNQQVAGAELDSVGINLLSWNIKKGQLVGWQEDLHDLAQGKDLVLIQESVLTPEFIDVLDSFGHWSFGPGYLTRSHPTGVITFSRSEPLVHCNLTNWEPWLGTPKSTSITEYGLSGTDKTLVVVNIHAVNFTFGIGAFQEQIRQVSSLLKDHDGPVIFSGDFNTWRARRLAVLNDLGEDMGLRALSFDDDQRKTAFGRRLDHVYVRGLTATSTRVLVVQSSDHNPLVAELGL